MRQHRQRRIRLAAATAFSLIVAAVNTAHADGPPIPIPAPAQLPAEPAVAQLVVASSAQLEQFELPQPASGTELAAAAAAAPERGGAGSASHARRPAAARGRTVGSRHADVDAAAEPASESPAAEPAQSARELLAERCGEVADGLLRDGAELLGRQLCVDSVHEARSDAAAAAVVEAFDLLGLPYSRARRDQPGYADCSGFVGRAWRHAGHQLHPSTSEPSSGSMRNAVWADPVDTPLAGDIMWRPGHVALALAHGYMAHASKPGDVTHVTTLGSYETALAVNVAALPVPAGS